MPSDPDTAPISYDPPQDAAGAVDSRPVTPNDSLPVSPFDILERISDAFVLLDSRWHVVYANREACRINQKPPEEFVGKTLWEEWPAAAGSEVERQSRRAMSERVEAHFQHRYVSGPYNVWLEIDVYPAGDGLSVFYRDITARKQAEEALRRSREDLRLAVDAAHLGTFYCDYPLHKIIWNATCAEHFFLPHDAEVDFALFYSLLHPDDREPTRRAIARAQAERVVYDVEYRTQAPDGRTRWVNAVGRFYYDTAGVPIRFDGITRDISQRKLAEEALHRSEEALRASEERLRGAQMRLEAALSAGEIATWSWDLVNERIVADANLARLFALSPEDVADGRRDAYLRAVHPDDRDRVTRAMGDVLAHGEQYDHEYRVLLPDGGVRWLAARGKVERDAEGKAVALTGIAVDITHQTERRRRERFRTELAERARTLTDPDEVIADAVRSLGEFLGVSRCVFADIDIAADTCTCRPDYRADETVASIAGTFPISAFGPYPTAEYEQGRAVAADDVRADPARFPAESVTAYDAIGVRAFIAAPVLHSARLVSIIAAHSAVPREWRPEEIALLQTVVERTWLTVEVARQQHALVREAEERREAHARTARILGSITDAFFALDTEWRFTYINDQSEKIMARSREDLLGRGFWDEFPATLGTVFERSYRRAMSERVTVLFQEYYPPLDIWVDVRAYPSPDGLSVFYQDVSARRRAEEALRQSEERYRLLVEGARDYAMILLDTDGHITSWNAGAERILGWGEAEVLGLPADLIFTPEDRVAGVPAQELTRAAAEGRALDLRWHLRKEGRRFYADGIMQSIRDERGQLRGFAKVLRDATERKVLEEERERLADANRLLLDSTGEGIYGIDLEGRFTFVNRAAARMLGFTPEQMVGRDGHALIHHTRPDGLPYPVDDCPIHRAIRSGRSASVEDDVFWRRDGTPCPVAYSAAPIFEHGRVRGAVVTFSDVSARRALEQERERVAERERNIAAHLQAALTPALPERVPGLALTKHYEAALEEAGVGGDFYDGFAVGADRTALVVGDLAGKGLAAAAQVSTVRNMLRAFLYSQPTVAEAVTELNRVLAENALLTGFATLFVGVYDSVTGHLQYVNCGQEPALVRRANTGTVEALEPTGPILGAIEGLRYPETGVALASGDVVAIFTDGLTEVGASHRDMLGAEGVAAFLAEPIVGHDLPPAERVAELLTLRLIAGVNDFAQSGARDDTCLLVAVVR